MTSRPLPFFERHALPIGIQLFPLLPELGQDFDGTLKSLADIGFESVELSGFLGREPADWRAALDRAGLKCCGVHIMARALGPGDNLSGDLTRLIDGLHAVGATSVVTPIFYIPERFDLRPGPGEDLVGVLRRVGAGMTADDWKWNADFLNEKGRVLGEAGITLGYHNHNFEFAPLGSTTGFDILIGNTDPALVTFELDTGWAAAADVDPAALLRQHPGRFGLLHMKDIKGTTQPNYALGIESTEAGAGKIDWLTVLDAAHAAGVRGFIVEQEAPFDRPAIEAMAINFHYIKSIRGDEPASPASSPLPSDFQD